MMISIRPLAALCLLLLACGPKISGESAEEGEASSTTEAPGTESGPPGSSGGPTTTPLDTGEGTADSGVVDTGEVWLDLPTSCSTFAQDCPPGFKCMPWASDGGNSWNATRCVPIAPDPNAPGEPCTVEGSGVSGLDDCDGTSMCWDVDPDTLEGHCVSFCSGDESDPSCPDPCDWCTITSDGALNICFDDCDPVLQNCPEGQACYAVSDSFACVADASPPGATVGSPCEYLNGCPPGLMCIDVGAVPGCDSGSAGCCAPFCPVDGVDPCPGLVPGSECLPWFEGGVPPEVCVTTEPGICASAA